MYGVIMDEASGFDYTSASASDSTDRDRHDLEQDSITRHLLSWNKNQSFNMNGKSYEVSFYHVYTIPHLLFDNS